MNRINRNTMNINNKNNILNIMKWWFQSKRGQLSHEALRHLLYLTRPWPKLSPRNTQRMIPYCIGYVWCTCGAFVLEMCNIYFFPLTYTQKNGTGLILWHLFINNEFICSHYFLFCIRHQISENCRTRLVTGKSQLYLSV